MSRREKRRRRIIAKKRRKPWTRAARRSRALRKQLDKEGRITPHFTWKEMADTRGVAVPRRLHKNAIRHCWNLERFRHALGDVSIAIDGPYRTPDHNRDVGGAINSRHTFADASDHFGPQVDRWIRQSPKVNSRADVIRIADRIFKKGGVGNETSGTLHLDSRGWRARFVTWVRS